jgi:hypothetical protein
LKLAKRNKKERGIIQVKKKIDEQHMKTKCPMEHARFPNEEDHNMHHILK